ncbi:MAG TPA: hypothetical protein VKA53_05390 [Thermoanaerobaculia bacterium]|nr:hypothetical protein [Thermoanaerobaculia bacterium]
MSLLLKKDAYRRAALNPRLVVRLATFASGGEGDQAPLAKDSKMVIDISTYEA